MDPEDIEIPDAWDDGEEPDQLTVKKLVEDCKKRSYEWSLNYLATAQFNERMIVGDQFIRIGEKGAIEDFTEDDWPSFVPRSSRNLLRNLALTWSSRILEDRPWVAPYASVPGTPEMATQVAKQVLEYCRQTHDFDDQCFRAANLVQPHSCVAWKVVWDPLRGPPSRGVPVYDESGVPTYGPDGKEVVEGAGEPEGDVLWDLVSVFDYATDGAEEVEDAKWCYFSKMMDDYDARSILVAAGMDPKPSMTKYTDVWGVSRDGVEVTELWWRPDARFPKGLYAVVVGDQPVQVIPFPYEHGEIPLAVWKCGSRRQSPFGSTHVDDAVPIQRVINETVAALQQQARQIGSVKLLAASSIVDAIKHGNQMIPTNDPQAIQAARYLEPPARSQVLTDTLEDNVNALYAIYGLNEILSGAENVKSGTSAKSIAYLNKLDSMKQAGASRSLGKAILRICRQTLKLYQQYVKAPRLAQIAGDQNLLAAQEFQGADLMGVDVKLEAASALASMRGAVAGDAADAIAAGSQDPSLAGIAATGMKDTSMQKASRDIVRAEIGAALAGEMQQGDKEVDPALAIAEIQTVLASIAGHPFAGLVTTLMQNYQLRLSQTQEALNPQPQETQNAG